MHRQLKRLLGQAYGVSESAVVITVDVRGFTEFCQAQEAPAAAQYLRRVYLTILDSYFPKARFFKPTGDGLLIIRPYTPRNLKDVATKTISASVDLVRDFATLCKKDPMVNFPVPTRIGIGICRGSVCAMVSGKGDPTTVDYSGRYLNLSARLTDMARPAGVVFDSAFDIGLLPDPLQALFEQEAVFVRSVAEDSPMSVYYTKEYTHIPSVHKTPLNEPRWRTYVWARPLRELESARTFLHPLPSRPANKESISVTVEHPWVDAGGKPSKEYVSIQQVEDFDYDEPARGPRVRLKHGKLAAGFRKRGVKGTWLCRVRISYHEAPS